MEVKKKFSQVRELTSRFARTTRRVLLVPLNAPTARVYDTPHVSSGSMVQSVRDTTEPVDPIEAMGMAEV